MSISQGHDILIFQNQDNLPERVRERLHGAGFATETIGDQNIIVKRMGELKDPILLIDCPRSNEECLGIVKWLLASEPIHKYPVVLVGYDVSTYQPALNQRFELNATLDLPCKATDVIQNVVEIHEKYQHERQAAPVTTLGEPGAVTQRGASEPRVHALYTQFGDVSELLFNQIESLQLHKGHIKGHEYTSKIDEEALKKWGYLPQDPAIEAMVSSLLSDAGKWGRSHLCRVLFLVSRLGEVMQIPLVKLDHAKNASVLYCWSFVGTEPELLRKDYFKEESALTRKDLCSKIKDSAMRVEKELKISATAEIITTLAKLIGGEEQVDDRDVSLLASLVMAADLVDRSCFFMGHWNTRSAYFLLKNIRAGALIEFHPIVLSCVIRLLTEKIASTSNMHLLKKDVRENPELIEQARQNQESPLEDHERRIDLDSLAPGMRLSKPLIAFDGREILEGDLILDQDLIWRIWQLSAVRPLNTPLIVDDPDS